jgi:hypothetical protein
VRSIAYRVRFTAPVPVRDEIVQRAAHGRRPGIGRGLWRVFPAGVIERAGIPALGIVRYIEVMPCPKEPYTPDRSPRPEQAVRTGGGYSVARRNGAQSTPSGRRRCRHHYRRRRRSRRRRDRPGRSICRTVIAASRCVLIGSSWVLFDVPDGYERSRLGGLKPEPPDPVVVMVVGTVGRAEVARYRTRRHHYSTGPRSSWRAVVVLSYLRRVEGVARADAVAAMIIQRIERPQSVGSVSRPRRCRASQIDTGTRQDPRWRSRAIPSMFLGWPSDRSGSGRVNRSFQPRRPGEKSCW